MTRAESHLLRRRTPSLCAWLAASCLCAVAAAEPASQATLANQNPASLPDPLGLGDLLVSTRTAGSGFFSGAAPDLAKGLVLNGALAFGADRALQRRSSDPGSGVALATSSAFAIAPILRTHYGWAAGASAYALAVAAGTYAYTREDASGSSVLVGSALGLAVGEAVALHSSRAGALRDHVIMGRKGLGLKMRF